MKDLLEIFSKIILVSFFTSWIRIRKHILLNADPEQGMPASVGKFIKYLLNSLVGPRKYLSCLASVKYIKIAEKYLQNLEPLHKNVLDNEPRVQMSFNHEKTVLKVLSNCLFKAEKNPLKPKAKQAQMGYYREKRGSKFSQSCPFK